MVINLCVRNMPRISVDMDLTYTPLEDRETSFRLPETRIDHKENTHKLLEANENAMIKVEVNQIVRGCAWTGYRLQTPL